MVKTKDPEARKILNEVKFLFSHSWEGWAKDFPSRRCQNSVKPLQDTHCHQHQFGGQSLLELGGWAGYGVLCVPALGEGDQSRDCEYRYIVRFWVTLSSCEP